MRDGVASKSSSKVSASWTSSGGKLALSSRFSSHESDFATTASSMASTSSPASVSQSAYARMSSFRSLRLPRRRHLAAPSQQRHSAGIVACGNNGNSVDVREVDDDDDDIAILQPDDENPRNSEKKNAPKRLWRSLSTMRMALSSRTLSSKKHRETIMYSISFYPWKRDPRAYYSNPEAAAEWVPDTASKRCQICLTMFQLTRRRHHCRLCGRLICNECSLQRTYFPFSKQIRSQHHLIKDGAPQRTCNACAGTLKNMAVQNDPRVKRFAVHAPSNGSFDDDDDDQDDYMDSHRGSRRGSQHRKSITDDDIYVIDSGKSSRLALALPSTSQSQTDELDEILHARAVSRKNPKPRYYVINIEWLEQWLAYVHVDAAPEATFHRRRRHSSRIRHTHTRRHWSARPGPIANYALLDFVSGKLVPKDDLERSRGNDSGGDYRIVSEEVWNVFVRLYGGGPCIQLPLEVEDSLVVINKNGKGSSDVMVSTHPSSSSGSAGVAPPSTWIILELDDSLPPIACPDASELFKGKQRQPLRRAASVSSIRQQASSVKHRSSVFPIRETAPSLPNELERSQTYFSSDSYVNCITSPPYSIAEEKQKRSQALLHAGDSLLKSSVNSGNLSSGRISRSSVWRQWRSRHETGSSVSSFSDSLGVYSKGSDGTVLYEPAPTTHAVVPHERGSNAIKSSEISHVRSTHGQEIEAEAAAVATSFRSTHSDSSQKTTIAAVSAFAVAAAEARKKSALSLSFSRYSSILSSSMLKDRSSDEFTSIA
ncbi:Pleckstrin homology domain-containing family f member 2-like, partial [Globisporangium splendens]